MKTKTSNCLIMCLKNKGKENVFNIEGKLCTWSL